MITQSKIGLAVIIHNEIDLIDDFIVKNKIFDIFSEIKFLDDFSEDGTFEFLKSKENNNMEVFQRKLNFDFSAQRNYLNSLMQSQYILRLDSDEIMNDNLIEFICNCELDKDYYMVTRKEYVDSGYMRDTITPFLYKNIADIKWENEIHECVIGWKTKENISAECYIIHNKTSKRCEQQNQYYYKNWEKQRRLVDGDKK